jgi:hypothetical protein
MEDRCTEPVGKYIFFNRKGNESHKLGTGFFVRKRIISAIKRDEFISDRVLHTILRSCWFHIIVLNVRAPTEYTIDDVKDSCYEELECVFGKFHIVTCLVECRRC